MSNLLAYGSQLVGGAGHVIEDASGLDLTQRYTMQFTDYINATDDSTNSKTIISAAPTTVEWSDWSNMTDEEKAGTHWLVVNAPYVGGQVDTDLMTKLWENPSPTSSFAAQDITLSSSDYDYLLVEFRYVASSELIMCSIAPKGYSIFFNYGWADSSTPYAGVMQRSIARTNDTTFTVGSATVFKASTEYAALNTLAVPQAIYGIKKTITIDTSALIANVSTDASKCMLSDRETSVEDAFTPAEYGAPADVTKTSVATGATYFGEDIFTIPSTATRVFVQVVSGVSGNVSGFVECMKGLPTIAFDLSHVAEARVLWSGNAITLSYIYNGSGSARDIGLNCRYV